MSSVDDFALLLPCPACGAEPTYWCVTYRPTTRPAGLITTWLHQPRLQIVSDAYRAGRLAGGESALAAAAQRLEARRLGHAWAMNDGVPFITHGETVEAWLRERAESHRVRGY